MKKRILSLLLSICLILTILPGTALAAGETFTYEIPDTNIVLEYQVDENDEITITRCFDRELGELELPAQIDGKRVTSIGAQAFFNCVSLTSITIPASVTTIGDGAFCNCIGLTRITFPNSVTTIGEQAFRACSGLTNIMIPDSVTNVGNNAFTGCNKLTSAGPIGSGCSIEFEWNDRISDGAFSGLDSLTSITIPDSVTTIGNGAFSSCSGLTNITIPDAVTTIGNNAFSSCSGLTNITIPDAVTTIGEAAFSGCSSLTNIAIPDFVTSIGDWTFFGCTSLTSIKIPDSISSIGTLAFSYCTALTSIKIPDSVTTIGVRAFTDGDSLISIMIPKSVTDIGNFSFGYLGLIGTTKMDSFTINGYCGSTAESYATENGFTFSKTHDATTIPAVAPTCTEPGLTVGSKCAGCGEVITAQTEIPALGHDFTGTYLTDEIGHWHKCSRCDAVDTKAAHIYNTTNCGEAANCTVCGYTKAAGAHTWNAGEVIMAPTCTTTGTMKYTCTSCGETKEETIPVSNHTPGNTWASDGAGHWHNCTVCNQKVDSASHTFGSWTTTKAATATEAGSRERVCTVCGYKQTETIPATGGGSSGGGNIGGGSVVVPPAEEKKDEEQTTNTAVYNDIPANAWYNDAVSFVTEKGLMSGTGTSTFAPGANLTRAMLAQILYNNENKPTTSGNAFTDVQSGAWYTNAITWATQKGIVSGYGNGQFGPDDSITREQLAVMLWRYAGQPTSNDSLNGFTDIDNASGYALIALQWAVETGIISGKENGTLDPTGNATRAEVAQMLMNYFK